MIVQFILNLLGGEAALSTKVASVLRKLLVPVTAWLLAKNADPMLIDAFANDTSVWLGSAVALIVSILWGLLQKAK